MQSSSLAGSAFLFGRVGVGGTAQLSSDSLPTLPAFEWSSTVHGVGITRSGEGPEMLFLGRTARLPWYLCRSCDGVMRETLALPPRFV